MIFSGTFDVNIFCIHYRIYNKNKSEIWIIVRYSINIRLLVRYRRNTFKFLKYEIRIVFEISELNMESILSAI